MKQKVMTRAMALLLAVILSFTLIVPETFAANDSGNEDAVSVDIIDGSADTEDAETVSIGDYFTYDPDFAQKALDEYNALGVGIGLDDTDLSGTPMTMAGTSTYLSIGTTIWYGGEGWGGQMMYTTDSGEDTQTAYCVNPNLYSPSVGTYTKIYDFKDYMREGKGAQDYQYEYLRKIMWYMPGCPGYEEGVEAGIWPDLWPSGFFMSGATEYQMQYIAGHLLVSWYYNYNLDIALSYMSTYFVQWFYNYVLGNYSDSAYDNTTGNKIVKYMPSPPDSFKIYVINPGTGTQAILGWEYEPDGYLKVVKTSPNMDTTSGNYSMAGAQYTAYTDEACTQQATTADGDPAVMTIAQTSNNTWESNTIKMATGSYWVKETKVPDGFNADTNVYPVTITGDNTESNPVIVYSSDYTLGSYLSLEKSSTNPDITNGNSCYSFAGAEYTVYTDSGCSNVAKTFDYNNGEGRSDAVLKVNADGSSNEIALYAGTYYVKETALPTNGSYGWDENVYTVDMTANPSDHIKVQVADPPVDDDVLLTLTKISEDSDLAEPAPLDNAEFTVKYYDGYYDTTKDLPSSATRTWVIKTMYNAATGKYIAVLDDDYKVSGDDFYYNNGVVVLPLGTITVQETKAPEGYTLDGSYLNDTTGGFVTDEDGVILMQVNSDSSTSGASVQGGNYYTKTDIPIRGGVAVYKYDPETVNLMDNPQGDADLAGATFAIKSLNDYQVEVDGNPYSSGEIVKYIETEKVVYDDGSYNYYAYTDIDTLPYGDYEIYEADPSTGYMIPGTNYDFTFKIENNLEYHSYDLNGNKIQVGNNVQRGGVGIYKYDSETYTMMTTPQGDADLEGAGFTIINRSKNPVYVEGALYKPGEEIMTITTVHYSDGTHHWYYANTADNALPYGTYEIIETESSEGYLIGNVSDYTFTIDSNNDFELIDITPSNDGNVGQFNDVIRGGVEIQKRDLESGYDTPEGGASLEGAEFTVFNESRYPVLVNGELYQPGEVVLVLYTDENGYVSVPDDTLPYGSYHVEETLAPQGYLPHDQHKESTKDDNEPVGVLERDFVIRTEGEIVDLTDQTYDFNKQAYVASADAGDAIYNQVIRGDFAIRKITDDQHTMRGVIFSIESVTTGEIHYFMTDENGAYSSASEYADHSYDTNYHDDESTWNETDDEGLRHHVGMWFSGYGNDDEGALVDDSLGALPYDTYKITEIQTEANKGYTIWEDTFTVGPNDNNIVIDLNDIEDTTWDIDTVATFESTNSKYAPVSENTITIDAVSYENLTTGHEYTLVAKLYDKNTQNFVKNAYGEDVMSVTAFTPRLHFGTANTEIVFDSTGLDGHDIVVFEYVYDGDEIIGDPVLYETDPEEANQTLHFPEVQTTALDADTGTHTSLAGETITIVDTVEYSNLQPGREYTVTGTLMNKDTGKPVLTADGEEITSEVTFTPDEPDGYVTVVFDFDGTGLEGVVTVVFEHVYYKGVEYAAHADINDEGQTVYIPKIHTTAWAEETGINTASAGEEITLYDTVTYKGVEPDQEYHIFSVLFDAETHEAEVDADGNEIWSDIGPFTAEESEGQVDVEFNIDASQMEGHRTVFYEILYQVETNEETGETTYALIAEEDLADAPDETIYFPDIHTNAYDSETGAGVVEAKENVTLIDTVTYTNLAPGHEYTVTGVLMNKETGEPILDAEGNQVTSEAAFTPEEPDGTVEVEFTFDATGLEGTTVVVFEDLYYEDIQLTVHADIDDEDQSVYIPKLHTTALDSETDDHISMSDENVTIIDTVEYTNLQPGNEYTVTGTLMDKETGEAMLDDSGEVITAETTFVPEEADGFVDMEFTFSGVSLAGKTLVAFESVTCEDIEVAVHADIEDEDQTVYAPGIHTTAVAESTGTHEVTAEGTVTIVDTVEYTNLLPGKTYTMSGELMDESTGESLGITANTVFTPEEPDGTVDVTFTFDADDMADTTVVVFEECSIAVEDVDVPVAEHKDLTDTDQQVKLTAPPVTDTPAETTTGTPTSTSSPKTGQIAGFSALGVTLAAAGAAIAGTVARKKRTGAGA